MPDVEQLLPLPTIEGKVRGIVGWDPCVLQCTECGTTATDERGKPALHIILSRFLFCPSEKNGPRRCPTCVRVHAAECVRCASNFGGAVA